MHISRRDLAELIDVLRQAEELCDSIRSKSQDFRMHRVRLELLRNSSMPPPPQTQVDRRESTRYLSIEDLKPEKKRG